MTVEVLSYNDGQKIMNNTEMNLLNKSGGISVEGTSKTTMARMDNDGFTLRNALGTIIAQMNADGFAYFSNSGTKIASVGIDGFEYFDGNGNKIADVDTNGFNFYDNNQVLRATISQSGSGKVRMLVYDETGKAITIMGQDPKDGKPVIAASVSGYDVEKELAA